MRVDLKWEYADTGVSNKEVKDTGEKIGYHLPKDYINCVSENGGASVLPEEFIVDNIERCFGSLFSFDKGSGEYIVKKYEVYKPTLPKDIFPIASDPGGNLICFDYKDNENNPVVVFWEHENAGEKEMLMRDEGITEEQAEERARENVFYVAESFTAFLDKLYD